MHPAESVVPKYWYRKKTHVQSRQECVKQTDTGPQKPQTDKQWWLRWSQHEVYCHDMYSTPNTDRSVRTLSLSRALSLSYTHVHLYTCAQGCNLWLDGNRPNIIPAPDLAQPRLHWVHYIMELLQVKQEQRGKDKGDTVGNTPRKHCAYNKSSATR